MEIRLARIEDAKAIKALHDRAALELCQHDYTLEQLDEWVKYSSVEIYQKRLEIHRTFVGEIDDRMVGFVRWNPETNELCSIFVDPDYARQGIATQLMERVYEDVLTTGVNQLWLYASLTAVPFYEAQGWKKLERTKRGNLECIKMEKDL